MDNEKQDSLHILSVLVNNKPGVLARIALTFSRRGYNIDSLVVAKGRNKNFSRMTIGIRGDEAIFEQIIKQVSKLIDVIHCYEHLPSSSVSREMALIKLKLNDKTRTEILHIIQHFGAKTVDFTQNSLIAMVSGDTKKVSAAIQLLAEYDVIETVRTGCVVMARGEDHT